MTPIEDTYQDVSYVLDALARDWVRSHPLDHHEDVRADANLFFMQAFATHRLGSSPFRKWLAMKVWKGLLEGMRLRVARNNRLRRQFVEVDHLSKPASEPKDYDDLSNDARTVVKLVLDPPPIIKEKVGDKGGNEAPRYKRALRYYLKRQGWSKLRMDVAFEEIHDRI